MIAYADREFGRADAIGDFVFIKPFCHSVLKRVEGQNDHPAFVVQFSPSGFHTCGELSQLVVDLNP